MAMEGGGRKRERGRGGEERGGERRRRVERDRKKEGEETRDNTRRAFASPPYGDRWSAVVIAAARLKGFSIVRV